MQYSLNFADIDFSQFAINRLPHVLEPAAFPLVTSCTIHILNPDFPWKVLISKPSGIFVYAILCGIRDCLETTVDAGAPEYEHLEQDKKDDITRIKDFRAAKTPNDGSSKQMLRMDFLNGSTWFGGLQVREDGVVEPKKDLVLGLTLVRGYQYVG